MHIFRIIMPSVTVTVTVRIIVPSTIPIIVIVSHLLQFLNEAALVELNLHGSLPADHLLEVAPVHQAEVGLGLDQSFSCFTLQTIKYLPWKGCYGKGEKNPQPE